MLDQITPIILTYNEAPNIGRVLEKLGWAKEILVVDSFSHDETLEMVKQNPRARVVQRKFDNFGDHRNFALERGEIKTEWIIFLDADYILTDELIEEIKDLRPAPDIVGYRTRFVYCIYGRLLRSTVYPPLVSLFRKDRGRYVADGHTQKLMIQGRTEWLKSPILHDDWKSLDRWLASQDYYARLEVAKLIRSELNQLSLIDRFRKMVFFAPFAMFWYCLFGKRLILDGRVGWYYTFQRLYAEMALSLYLMQYKLEKIFPKLD